MTDGNAPVARGYPVSVELVIQRALLDDENFGNRAADQDQLEEQARGSAVLIAEAIAVFSSDGSEAADGAIGSRGLTGDPRKCQPFRSEGETTRPVGVAPGPSEAVTEAMVTAAMRAFELMSSVLRYREKDKWHSCDIMGMRDAIRAALAAAPQPIGLAQPPTKPWVCCNCDADLSCGACGVEQPNDGAYYERIIKENELLTDRLETAQKIIAECKASTTAGAKADVAAHGLPGARGQGGPELSPEMLQAGAQALADDVWHPPQKFESLPPSDANRYRRQALLVLKAACSVSSTGCATPSEPRLAERLADVVMMLDTPDAYNREYIAAVCRSILSSATSTQSGSST